MKFNWGTGLIIFFTIFIGTLAFIVYKSTTYDNSLVVDDYYEQDIKYQEHYDKLQNTTDPATKVNVEYRQGDTSIILNFPGDSTTTIIGKLVLYNPISKNSDLFFDIKTNEKLQFDIPVANLSPGKWKAKIDWQIDRKAFYQEETLIIK